MTKRRAKMKQTVKIFNTPTGWMARFSDVSIKEAFGSDTIPTAFTEKASPMMVLERIKALNPDCEVSFN